MKIIHQDKRLRCVRDMCRWGMFRVLSKVAQMWFGLTSCPTRKTTAPEKRSKSITQNYTYKQQYSCIQFYVTNTMRFDHVVYHLIKQEKCEKIFAPQINSKKRKHQNFIQTTRDGCMKLKRQINVHGSIIDTVVVIAAAAVASSLCRF